MIIIFILVLRSVRSIIRTILNLRQGFDLISYLLSYLDGKEIYSYQKYLALEGMVLIFSDYDLLFTFYKGVHERTLAPDVEKYFFTNNC